MVTRRIPVVVLAGFLGSGKTTLLNHLLLHSRGARIGAVVNDFGSIGIDAMSVAGQVDSMVSLGDGCLCCAVDTEDIDGMLERLADPATGMDVIVVEASGLAEPETLIRMILASSSAHTVYGGLAEVVDAAAFESVRERHPELARHVRAADLVVLNKTDLAAPAELDRLTGVLNELAPGTPVVPVEHGRIDPELLFEPSRRPRSRAEQLSFGEVFRERAEREAEDHSGHLHAAYESVAFTSAAPLDPRRFLDFLDSRPAGLYRIKGFVDFGAAGPGHRYTVHAVGGFLRFTPGEAPGGEGGEQGTRLVLIGSGIDAQALRTGLRECLASESDGTPDPHALWGVLRYVDDGGDEAGGPDGAGAPTDTGTAGEAALPFA